MIQKWKKSLENGKTFTALLTDLSKAFDCLPLKCIIGKLNAYGFGVSSSFSACHTQLFTESEAKNKDKFCL